MLLALQKEPTRARARRCCYRNLRERPTHFRAQPSVSGRRPASRPSLTNVCCTCCACKDGQTTHPLAFHSRGTLTSRGTHAWDRACRGGQGWLPAREYSWHACRAGCKLTTLYTHRSVQTAPNTRATKRRRTRSRPTSECYASSGSGSTACAAPAVESYAISATPVPSDSVTATPGMRLQ